MTEDNWEPEPVGRAAEARYGAADAWHTERAGLRADLATEAFHHLDAYLLTAVDRFAGRAGPFADLGGFAAGARRVRQGAAAARQLAGATGRASGRRRAGLGAAGRRPGRVRARLGAARVRADRPGRIDGGGCAGVPGLGTGVGASGLRGGGQFGGAGRAGLRAGALTGGAVVAVVTGNS